MLRQVALIGALVVCMNLVGCERALIRPNDEVFVFNKPYDFTFLRVLDAINDTHYWSLYGTDKEKGIITVWNQKFTDLFDADKQFVTFLVRRVERHKTSVQIAPQSQYVTGSGELLRSIDRVLSLYRE